MSIRRFAIRADDYEKVHAWLKKATKGSQSEQDEKAEEKMAEAPPEGSKEGSHTVPADFLPKIRWAHLGPLQLVKAAHGKEVIYVREAGTPKRLIHHKEVDGYLRDALLSASSDVPMSRDAGYHIVQKRTVGISRRTFYKFMQKQAVLQVTRWKLPEMKRPGRPLEGRGYLELDLVEAKGRDIGKFVHHPVKDFYWITLVDRLTGWLVIQRTVHKDVASVAPKLRGMLRKMARALKTDIKYIRSDSGSEFKSDTQAVFKELKIRHKFVKSGNRVEQANRTFQKIWYRLMRLGRGHHRARRTGDRDLQQHEERGQRLHARGGPRAARPDFEGSEQGGEGQAEDPEIQRGADQGRRQGPLPDEGHRGQARQGARVQELPREAVVRGRVPRREVQQARGDWCRRRKATGHRQVLRRRHVEVPRQAAPRARRRRDHPRNGDGKAYKEEEGLAGRDRGHGFVTQLGLTKKKSGY